MGPPFPIKSNTKCHKSIIKSYSKEKNGGRDTGAAAWEEQNNPRTEYKSRTKPNTSEGVFIPAETGQTGSMDRSDRLVRPVRPVPGTGQTGWLDRSDRCQGPVRPVGLQHPLYTISSDGRGSFFETKSSLRCRRLDEDPVRGFGGSAKPG